MKHGYGIKINGNCYNSSRRFLPLDDITAYITFDNTVTNIVVGGPDNSITELQAGSQWRDNTTLLSEPSYDKVLSGFSYNERYTQKTFFENYYFDINDINAWGTRSVFFGGDPPPFAYEFYGPKFKNTFTAIPLSKHKINPISKLKKGRLSYNFLDASPSDIFLSPLVDPFEFVGVYPYSPEDSVTVRKPAGWMYSNKNVPEPYYTEINYEGGKGKVDRSTADTSQLNFLPFVNPIRVFDLNEKMIGEFDGFTFVLFFGEMALKLPFKDLPEYNGLIEGVNPLIQTFGLEANIFLTGKNVLSPRVGRIRWYLQNKQVIPSIKNDPELNYFTMFFMKNGYSSGNYTMPLNLKVRPSQLNPSDEGIKVVNLTLSNLKIMVGA